MKAYQVLLIKLNSSFNFPNTVNNGTVLALVSMAPKPSTKLILPLNSTVEPMLNKMLADSDKVYVVIPEKQIPTGAVQGDADFP